MNLKKEFKYLIDKGFIPILSEDNKFILFIYNSRQLKCKLETEDFDTWIEKSYGGIPNRLELKNMLKCELFIEAFDYKEEDIRNNDEEKFLQIYNDKFWSEYEKFWNS